MFGLSAAEAGVIFVVALIFLRPKDVISFIKTFRKITHFIRSTTKECHTYIEKILSENEALLQKEKDVFNNIGKKLEQNLDISKEEKEKYKESFKDIL